ncbi:TcdA/TcdB pore-forming domain-containing protein, partial [Pseudomonas chlororaphis]|uniref:TcdA/TcdB pore-forming domain-containing protein n=1 Tax=Pseudomonas chlororaphis TaxID=587753 RepID=UPI0039F17E75
MPMSWPMPRTMCRRQCSAPSWRSIRPASSPARPGSAPGCSAPRRRPRCSAARGVILGGLAVGFTALAQAFGAVAEDAKAVGRYF